MSLLWWLPHLWGLAWMGRSCLHGLLHLTLGALVSLLECLQRMPNA